MMNRIEIKNIFAREVINSKGYPTAEVEVYTDSGVFGSAIVPLNDYNISMNPVQIIDNNVKRYSGKGSLNVVDNINNILAKELIGINVLEQRKIDNYMIYLDGTNNKSSLGTNAILGVSMAVARAAANSLNIPLYMYIGGVSGSLIPTPMMCVLNYNKIKEVIIVSRNIETYGEKLRASIEVYHELKDILTENNIMMLNNNSYDIKSDYEALNYIMKALEKSGYEDDFAISLKIDSNQMYKDGDYLYDEKITSNDLIEMYNDIVDKYPIISIEDGLARDDLAGWKNMTDKLGKKIHLIGNEIFFSDISKLEKAVQNRIANSILVKISQIGTITETIDLIKYAKANGFMPIISNSSYETEDTFISDLSVALNIRYIKCGEPNGSQNVSKYNQLMRIEENILNTI